MEGQSSPLPTTQWAKIVLREEEFQDLVKSWTGLSRRFEEEDKVEQTLRQIEEMQQILFKMV